MLIHQINSYRLSEYLQRLTDERIRNARGDSGQLQTILEEVKYAYRIEMRYPYLEQTFRQQVHARLENCYRNRAIGQLETLLDKVREYLPLEKILEDQNKRLERVEKILEDQNKKERQRKPESEMVEVIQEIISIPLSDSLKQLAIQRAGNVGNSPSALQQILEEVQYAYQIEQNCAFLDKKNRQEFSKKLEIAYRNRDIEALRVLENESKRRNDPDSTFIV